VQFVDVYRIIDTRSAWSDK